MIGGSRRPRPFKRSWWGRRDDVAWWIPRTPPPSRHERIQILAQTPRVFEEVRKSYDDRHSEVQSVPIGHSTFLKVCLAGPTTGYSDKQRE